MICKKNPLIDIYNILVKIDYPILSDAEFSKRISDALAQKKPFMVGRIGATESSTLRIVDFGYRSKYEKIMNQLVLWSGFFPEDIKLIERFAEIYERAIADCDIVFPMRYRGEQYLLSEYAKNNIEYYHDYFVNSGDDIWFRHLKGKKVLVIHPFSETIQRQYLMRREFIHKSQDVLPEFELRTIKAVFTAAGEQDNRFSNWFEALEYMHQESKKIDYDIALIGCGAYGFPLASMIKQDGKIAVHMGGSLQLLFGIKGARWDQIPGFAEK